MSDSAEDKDFPPGSPAAAALWRRARAEAQGVPAPEAMTLAAYVDGTLEAAACDRVEAWMAASPEALDLIATARAAAVAPLPPVPADLMTRARGLVDSRPAVAGAVEIGLFSRLADLARPSAWAAATAAVLLAAVFGFELGRETTVRIASVISAPADDGADFAAADDLL